MKLHPVVFKGWEYLTQAPLHPSITVVKRPGVPKERKVTALVNIGSGLELGVYNSTLGPAMGALSERVFYVKGSDGWQRPITPVLGFWRSVMKVVGTELYLYPCVELSVEDFLSRYKGTKLSTYQRARDELIHFGFERKKHTLVKAFVKDERQKSGAAPRLIRPFSALFNLLFGRFVYPLEKAVYTAINRLYGFDHPTVTKGMNAIQVATSMRGKWDSFGDPICVFTDMSRFDQHCSVDSLIWARNLLVDAVKRGGGDSVEFSRLWDMTINTSGIVIANDGIIKYKVNGTLNSGLSSTSLVGVLLTCAILRTFCLLHNIPHQLISAGDDTNIICERLYLPLIVGQLPAFAAMAGFVIKIEGHTNVFEQIDFCQSRPVWNGESYVMCRDPRVVMTKDLLTTKRLDSELQWRRYVRAIGDCGMSLCSGLPVMEAFYSVLIRSAGSVTAAVLERNGFYYMSSGLDGVQRGASPEARLSFYLAFGIGVDHQLLLEESLNKMTASYVGLDYETQLNYTLFPLLNVY